MTTIDNWNKLFNQILPKVKKPARYIGQERNSIIKNWDDVDVTIALAFPDLYDVGMSYYGFQILYHILNKNKFIAAERVYAPWPDFEDELRKNLIPLFSLETHNSLKDFDIIGFTFSYELGYTNMLNMLDMSDIAVFSKERQPDEPIVIAGGGSIFNSEPIAEFVDCIIPGDGEEILETLVGFIGNQKKSGFCREEIIKNIAIEFSGVYVPKFYEYDEKHGTVCPTVDFVPKRIKTNKINNLLNTNYPEEPIIPLMEIAQDRFVAEIMRGCTRGCRFCQAGIIYRPVRERKPVDIAEQVKRSFSKTGYGELSLLSLSTSDYNGLEKCVCSMLEGANKNDMSISFPSMRLDSFSEKVAEYAKQTRKSGLTFAPEAGSQRLRDVINKQISEKELLESVRIAVENGWKVIKLYFMLGLPGETMEDVLAIADLVEKVLKVGGRSLNVNVTLSSFIPKVFTPFQWEKQDSPELIQQKIDAVKPLLYNMKRVKVMSRDPRYSQLEGLMSRGDRSLGQVIFHAWKNGAKFDGWREFYNFDIWEDCMEQCGLKMEKYTGSRDLNASLPWEIIDPLVARQYLQTEREKAISAITTEDCRNGCRGCGVCSDDLQMIFADKKNGDEIIFAEVSNEQKDIKYRYRLNFVKTGAAKFTSHLDIIRIFKQAVKSASLKICYTGGYNKKPKISAGFPLPYTFTSEDEYIEIFLKNPAQNLDNLLNKNLPSGIQVKNYVELSSKTDSVSTLVNGFVYEVVFFNPLIEEIKLEIEKLLKMENVWVERIKKNISKKIDIRSFIRDIEVNENTITLALNVNEGRTTKVQEVLDALNVRQNNWYAHRKKTLFKAEFNQ